MHIIVKQNLLSCSSSKDLSLSISAHGANYLFDRIDLIEIDRKLYCGKEKYSVAQRKHADEL